MVTRIESKNSNLYVTEVLETVTINGKRLNQCEQKFDSKRNNVREIEFYHVDKELTTPKLLTNGGSIHIDMPTSYYSLTDKPRYRPSSSFDKGRIPEVTIEKISNERKEVRQYKTSFYSNCDFQELNKNKSSLATIKCVSDAKNIENHSYDVQNTHQQLLTKNSGPIDSSDANILNLNESSFLHKVCRMDKQALKDTETDNVINTENTTENDEIPDEEKNLKTTLNKTHKNKVENAADNPISAWKKADIEALQNYGRKPFLLKSVNTKETDLKFSLKDGNSQILNDRVRESNQPAIRKYMADKQLERKEAIKRKREDMHLQESRKIEKLKELDQKRREIARDSRCNQQSYTKEYSDRQPMIHKDFKSLAPEICAPHTSQTTEMLTFTVHVEPSKAIADTKCSQVYDPSVIASDHAIKTLKSNPLYHLENYIDNLTYSNSEHENIVDRDTDKEHKMAMREKHYKIKNYIEKPEYLSNADNVKDLLKKVVQKCDEKFLSSSSSIESSVSALRHVKKAGVDISTKSDNSASSDSSGLNLISANKKERISKLSLTAQKLSEQLKDEDVLNQGLQNLIQIDKVQYHPKFASQHFNKENENLSMEEIVKRMTALCPQSKFSEYIPSVTKENKINNKVQDASPEQSFVKPTLPFCAMELPQLKAPPMSVLTLKSRSRAKLKEYAADGLKTNVEKNSYYNRLYSPKELNAAITIQAFFRGHKVRKVTSNILKPRTKRFLGRSKDSSFPKLIKFTTPPSRANKILVPSTEKDILNELEYPKNNFNTKKNLKVYEFRPNYNIDAFMLCRKGSSKDSTNFSHLNNHRPITYLNKDDLEANTRPFVNNSQSNKFNLQKELPDFVKPFVDLTETGDIDAFVNSYSSINNKILNRATGEGVNHFLVKSPLLDIDIGENSQLTKETQTDEIDLKRFRTTAINDSQNFSLSEGPLLDVSNSSLEQEVFYSQLKKSRSKRHAAPKLLKMPSSKADLAMANKGIDDTTYHSSKVLSNKYGLTSSDSSSALPYVEASLNNSEDAILSESTANNNEINQFMTSEDDLQNISTYKVPVSKFGVRIRAELMYQDTIGSALDHLRELENLRIISQADAESSKSNSNLQEIELKNVELNNELAQQRNQYQIFEKEVQSSKKRLENGVSVNIERIEREARDRILRLEQECMSKAEAAFQLVGRTLPQNNPEMIAAATAAAVSASIGILGHSKCNFDNYRLKDSSKYPSCSQPINKESYSEDFSDSSESGQSAVEVSKSNADASESKISIMEGINLKNPSTSVSSDVETSPNAKVCMNETEISVTPDIVEDDFDNADILNSFEKYDLESSSLIHSIIPLTCNPKSSNEEMEIYEEVGTPIFDSHDTSHEIRTKSFKDIHINLDKSLDGSKLHKKIPADNTSASYSESFEPDSRTSDASETSSSIQRFIKQTSTNNGVNQLCCNSPVSMKNNNNKSSDRQIYSPHSQSGAPKIVTGALYSTLSLLESLQKEEEIRFNYQKSLLKMQEQKLMSEARQKLDTMHLEGGSNVRKKQRAILLQLKEQKSHIKQFIETQTLAAQQRQLIFLQHKDLLSSTTNISNATTLHSSRVASPSVSHMMDLNMSSSDSLNHVNNILPFKPIVKSSSELSEDESNSSKKLGEKRIKSVRDDSRKSSSPILKDRDSRLNKRDEKSWKRKELFPKINSVVKSKVPFKNEQGSCSHSETDNVTSDNENKPTNVNKSKVLKDDGIMLTEDKPIDKAFVVPVDMETVAKISIINEHSSTCNNSTSVSNVPFQENLALRQIPLAADIPKTILDRFSPKSEAFLIDKASSDSEMIVSNKYSSRYSNCIGKENRGNGIPFNLKIPLSPRAQLKQHRRQSSESDDSFTLSQNETASDFSDGGEGKLAALREELAMRRVEAEKLQKEKRKLRRERLASQEQSLKKQIQAYESYIKEAKLEIEKESRELQHVSVKPLIKRPHGAGAVNKKLERLEYNQHEKPYVSDEYGNILLGDKSILSNKSYTAADFENSHVSSGSSSKKSNTTEDSFSSTSMVDSQNGSHMDQSFSDNTVSFENEVELKSHNENQQIVNDSLDIKYMKEFDIGSSQDLAANEDGITGILADSYNNVTIVLNSEKYLESSKIEVPKSPDESSVSQESDLSASHASSTETILQSPKKSNSIEMEPIEDFHGINKMDSPVIEAVKLPVIPDSKVPENKVDIFIPSFDDNMVLSKETDDETIVEDIIEELPVDITSLTGDEQSALLKEESVIDSNDKNCDSNKKVIICEPLLKAVNVGDLRIKANEIAQCIFKNILENSIELMMGLFLRKEKEVCEISGQIQELGEVELKSENTLLYVNSQHLRGIDSSETCHNSTQVPAYTCIRMSLRKEGDLGSSRPLEEILNYESPVANVRPTPTPKFISSEIELKLVGEAKYSKEQRSPIRSPVDSKDTGINADELTSRLLSVQATHNALDNTLDESCNIREEFSVSSSDGNWPDNEWWISGDSFNAQLELKEEENKLNAEIALLEELQLFKKMHPNLVIREVPNKPPPPYVPPKAEEDKEHPVISPITPPVRPAVAKIKSNEIRPSRSVILPQPQSPSNTISVPHRLSKADLRKLAAELFNVVPSKEDDILPVIQSFVDVLFREWQNGINPAEVENPSKKEVDNLSQHNDDSDKEDVDSLEVSSQSFQNLLFDLTKELVSEIYILHKAPPTPIWMNVCLPHPAKPWQVVKCLTNENLFSYVMSKVRIHMGWEAPTKQESTMVKWARKRRDVVDQILVHELQAEELSWTNYDEEEVEVKNELAQEIMDSLLEDTTNLFQKIVENKIKISSGT